EVLEEAATLADQHQQAATGVVVLLVGLEVVGEAVDPLGQQRDLDLGRAGVALVDLELLDQTLLLVLGQPHTEILPGVPPPIATPPEPRPRHRWDGFVEPLKPASRRAECTTQGRGVQAITLPTG